MNRHGSMYLCISIHEEKKTLYLTLEQKTRVQVVRMGSKMLPDRPLQELAVLQTSTPLCHGKESKSQPKRRQRDFFGTRELPKPKTVAGPCDDPF